MLQVWLSRRRARQTTDHAYQNWLALRSENRGNDAATPPTPAQQMLKQAREKHLADNWGTGGTFQTEIFVSVRIPREQIPRPHSDMGPLSHLKSRFSRKSAGANPLM